MSGGRFRFGVGTGSTKADFDVVQADFEESGDEDVIRKLLGDITSAGGEISEIEVRAALEDKQVQARRALMGEA